MTETRMIWILFWANVAVVWANLVVVVACLLIFADFKWFNTLMIVVNGALAATLYQSHRNEH